MVRKSDSGWTFEFYHSQAKIVEVVGHKCDDRLDAISMTPCGNGWWTLTLQLPPGVYRFRYRINRVQWLTDWAAFGVEMDRGEGWVAMLYVPEEHRQPIEETAPAMLAESTEIPRMTAA